jgi:hypothetical protein
VRSTAGTLEPTDAADNDLMELYDDHEHALWAEAGI